MWGFRGSVPRGLVAHALCVPRSHSCERLSLSLVCVHRSVNTARTSACATSVATSKCVAAEDCGFRAAQGVLHGFFGEFFDEAFDHPA